MMMILSKWLRAIDGLLHSIETWRERAASRRRLAALPDRMLHDLGMGRAEAWREYRKPFWRC